MKKLSVGITLFLIFVTANMSMAQFGQDNFKELKYRNVGPSRGGRVTAVAGVPGKPSTFFMGATGGGVWKTTDFGYTWKNVSDGFFTTGSIGAIRVSPSNTDIVWVGTGSDGIRSNVIKGKGLFRSDDAGQTWKFSGLEEAGQIGALAIHPSNPDIVYVAAIGNPFGPNNQRGVFKTTDGGKTWKKVLYISDETGACDLELDPENPDVVYASVWTVRRKPWTILSGSERDGFFKSEDGGDNWVKIQAGLPTGIVGKSDLAVCPADPSLVYILMEAENDQGGLYISADKGESFKKVSGEKYLYDRPFYYTNVDVDPTNPDIIYVNCTGFYRSDDRGVTWTRRPTPHGDNHDMWINPSDPDIFIQSNDGGANVTRDGGETWSTQYNQPTAELYQVNVDDQFPYWLYAGQQDNTTVAIPSKSSRGRRSAGQVIMAVGGCETGPAVPKPGNPNIVYSNCKGRFGRYNKITGVEKQYYVGAANIYGHNPADLKYRFQRVSPIMVSHHDPNMVYHASQYLHLTRDEGVTWETISPDLTAFEPDKQVISGGPITRDITGEEYYSTIYAVAESPVQQGVIWTGANDGPVYLTKDGGETWSNVTPTDLAGGGRVQNIEPSPHNPAKAYIAVYRYLLDDWSPYIYMTKDWGQTWELLTDGTNGIPGDYPTRVVREDPDMEGLLYAGTEFGMFISYNDGSDWQPFQLNLPVVPVTDIRVYRNDLVLSTMGRSFWILDNISPLHQKNLLDQGGPVLFKPSEAYRSPSYNYGNIDYLLAEEASNINIDIINSKGNIVRSFKGGTNHDNISKDREIAATGTMPLKTGKGFHRLTWDLTTFGPSGSGRRNTRGPLVVPDRYKIVLDVDGNVMESSIEVLPDPGIIADGLTYSDYEEQYNLVCEIRDLITSVNRLEKRLGEMADPVQQILDSGKKPTRKQTKMYDSVKELLGKIKTSDERYPQPMLADQVSYLYSMLSRADQKPGKDAYIRLEELKKQFQELKDYSDMIR